MVEVLVSVCQGATPHHSENWDFMILREGEPVVSWMFGQNYWNLPWVSQHSPCQGVSFYSLKYIGSILVGATNIIKILVVGNICGGLTFFSILHILHLRIFQLRIQKKAGKRWASWYVYHFMFTSCPGVVSWYNLAFCPKTHVLSNNLTHRKRSIRHNKVFSLGYTHFCGAEAQWCNHMQFMLVILQWWWSRYSFCV